MLKKIRKRSALRLAADNRTRLCGRLDNIAQLAEEIRALPEGASAKELTARLLREAEDADDRATCEDELTAEASR